jgi:hypothetical protein
MILTEIDQDILDRVNITINGLVTSGPAGLLDGFVPMREGKFELNSDNLQFPPKITKDSKSSEWTDKSMSSYEPLKIYKGSSARSITIELQWVVEDWPWVPYKIHSIISSIKSYFYAPYLGSGVSKYPLVEINKFYHVITSRSTWRMMSIDVSYSEELIKSYNQVYPIHTKVSLNLESVTQIASMAIVGEEKGPASFNDNAEEKPSFSWF